jgi:16S rRNA (adenine1518-N6/adenine1519-N6)-dimethyltransferase
MEIRPSISQSNGMHRWTSILKQAGIDMKRGLGQNFIVEEAVLARIAAELPEGADVLEIGSGPGNLTAELAKRARTVWAYEVDPAWMKFARERVRAANIEWHLEDGENFSVRGRPHCVSNLPYAHYYRLTLALMGYEFERLCFTLQDDVFEKFSAKPGSDAYGPIAVLAQAHYDLRKIFDVPRSAFYPAPRVDSTFFSLTPLRPVPEPRKLDAALKQIFSKRNKKAGDKRIDQLEPSELLQRADELIHGR